MAGGMGVSGQLQYVNPLTTATLSGPTSGSTGVAVTYTVTLNVPANQTYTVTPSCPGTTVTPGTFSITAGNQSGTFTVLTPSDGTYSVDFTISPSLSRANRPITLVTAGLTWVDDIFPMTISQGSYFDLTPHISDPLSELSSITANVTLPSGVAITNTPSWRVTATSSATIGATNNVALTLVKAAQSDWQSRISGPSVVWYHSFDTAAEVNQFRWSNGYNSGNDPLGHGNDGSRVAYVASGGVDGGGFMRLTYPVNTAAGGSYWWRPFAALTGTGNGRGVDDPAASGTITLQNFTPTDGGGQTREFTLGNSNPGFYGSLTDIAANPTRYQGNDFYLQVRARRAGMPGPPPNAGGYTNITGKFIWPNVTTDSSTNCEIVTYGWAQDAVVGQQSRHRMYEGRNRSGGPGIGGNSETDTINNADGVNDWYYSGGWDTILYHITPGINNGTGSDRTRLEVWAQHDLTLYPAESGLYTKIWDVLYSVAYEIGNNSVGAPSYAGWNALILAIYHNGSVFTTTTFYFDYDQVIFSKATIAAPIAQQYSTSFLLTENQISENGAWSRTTVQSKTAVQTSGGNAFGTMTTFDGTNYNDSCACLTGAFPANQQITATLYNNGAGSLGIEAELLLRCTFDATHATCYELDLVNSGGHAVLVRWDFTSTSAPNAYEVRADSNTGPNPGAVSFANGAVWVFKIVGTVITATCNGTTVITYDTVGDSIKYATGSPGIGFWNATGSSANSLKLGWSDFVASAT